MFAYCLNNPVRYFDSAGCYCRDAASEYAEEWHDKKNEDYYYYSDGDCANFVSQCLRAGGLSDTSEWYHHEKTKKEWYEIALDPLSWVIKKRRYNWNSSDAWRLANEQYLYFSNPDNGYINGEVLIISAPDQIANIANNGGVQPGDLLYFSTDGILVHHATIVTKVENGMIYFAAHTRAQFDCPLSEKIGSETIFIIRIDDNA